MGDKFDSTGAKKKPTKIPEEMDVESDESLTLEDKRDIEDLREEDRRSNLDGSVQGL